jgi:hypothetical protein
MGGKENAATFVPTLHSCSGIGVHTVKAFEHEYVLPVHGLQSGSTNIEPAPASELERGVVRALQVEAVSFFRKLAYPQTILVFDRRLRAFLPI